MKLLVQRVAHSDVVVEGKTIRKNWKRFFSIIRDYSYRY